MTHQATLEGESYTAEFHSFFPTSFSLLVFSDGYQKLLATHQTTLEVLRCIKDWVHCITPSLSFILRTIDSPCMKQLSEDTNCIKGVVLLTMLIDGHGRSK